MVEEGGFSQSFFYGLEGLVAVVIPRQGFWFALQAPKQGMEMMSGLRYETSVVIYHTEESLEFFDGFGLGRGADCFNPVFEWGDAVLVDTISQKFEG